MYIDSRDLNILTISVKTTVPIVILVPHAAQNHAKLKQHVYILTLCSVCIHNIVQMNLGHPVTLVWMSLNHPVLLAWRQVRVGSGDSVECFDYRGTPLSIHSLVVAMCMIGVVSVFCISNLLWQWQELQLQQCWSSWWWLLYSLQSSGTSRGKPKVTVIVCH